MGEKTEFIKKVKREIEADSLKRYLLLLINSLNNEKIKGKTRLMKELFLISKNIPDLEKEADFEAHSYGPHSDYVSYALEDLETLNLINKIDDSFIITETGNEIADIIKKDVKKEEIEIMEDMKQLCNDLDTDEILALVYYTYPEMTVESLVKDRIGKKRKKIALNLLKKEKISIGKASEIAGIPIESFYEFLKTKGVKLKMGYP